MKNKVKLLSLFLLLFAFSMQAQVKDGLKKAEISFSKTSYKIGRVKEESGDVQVEFEFTNKGNANLTISDVQADKGVDIVSWPKGAIQPADGGKIIAIFHPKGNANSVNKKIKVTSNSARNSRTVLSITGYVEPIPGSIAAKFKRNLGNSGLMVKNTNMNFGNISNTKVESRTLAIYNNTDKSMKLTFKDVPKYLSVTADPVELSPNQEGSIIIDYNVGLNKTNDNKQKWGAQSGRFSVVINGDTEMANRNSVSVRSNIIEDFSSLTEEELAKAPKIAFESTNYDFGTIKQGDVVKHDFTYTNLGDSDLEIRYVKST